MVLTVPKPTLEELKEWEKKLREEMTGEKLQELEELDKATFKGSKC